MRNRLITHAVAAMALAALACTAPLAQASLTPTPSPTATATATLTPPPAPTGLPDVSHVVLKVDDFPLGFIDIPPSQAKSMESALNRDGFMQSLVLYGFYRPNTGESVIGVSGLLLKTRSSQAFDDSISLPQLLISGMGKELGATKTENVGTIDEVRGIGNRAGGAGGDITTAKGTLHMQIVVFRRGDIGVILMSFYRAEIKPLASIVSLATLLDERAKNAPSLPPGTIPAPALPGPPTVNS